MSSASLLSKYPQRSVHELFGFGIEALQQFFREILVDSFDHVFALVLFGYALMYSANVDEELYCREDLFENTLKWQYAITDKSNASSYVALIRKFWCQDCFPVQFDTGDQLTEPSSEELIKELGNSQILKVCSYFLDSKY